MNAAVDYERGMAGNRIRTLREQRAWTQEQLASAAGLAVRTVQRAEGGTMSAATRRRLATALAAAPADLQPEPMPAIQPVLVYRDSKAAVDWLVRAFGAVVRERVVDDEGQVAHGELVFGSGVVLVTRAVPRSGWVGPESLRGKRAGFLVVTVGDVDAHCAIARRAGVAIHAEPETSWGQRRYRCRDLEGHEWCFTQRVPT
ncbi:MAG: VOC family protein [Planctomycetes bacterium]|nr:VOC family protein [Planctomycetota bacterium]